MDNPGEVLRPDMFVDVEIPIEVPSTLAVSVAWLAVVLREGILTARRPGAHPPAR